jgi:hypothetical protein
MNFFNNREIVMVFWALVIFILVLITRDRRELIRRKSFLDAFKGHKKGIFEVFFSLVCMIGYTAVIVCILYQINFWNISLLKITFFWFCSGIVMCVNTVTLETDQNVFRKIISDNIKITIIVVFIVNFYTFSLVIEFFLVPIVTCIMLYNVFAEKDEKNSNIVDLMNGLQFIIVLIILICFIDNVVSDYKNFVSLDTLRKFLLPPSLTILFLPFIYVLVLFSTYEQLFVQLNSGNTKSKKLKRYAKRKIIQHCLFSVKEVKKLLNSSYNFKYIKNKEYVDNMIKDSK